MSRKVLALLVGSLIFLGVTPAVAHDPSADLEDVRRQMAELESKIDNSKAESRRVGKELADAQAKLDEALAVVMAAQAKVDAKQAEIDGAEQRITELTAQLEAIESRLAKTRARLAKTEGDLQQQAMIMYMDAATSTGSVMLAVSEGSDLAVGLAYLDRLAGSSEDLIDTFEILKKDEERQQSEIEVGRQEVATELERLEVQRADLELELEAVEEIRHEAEDELAQAQALLNRIRSDISSYEDHLDALEDDAARLQRELAASQSSAGTKPGVLAWPVNGRVSSPYGYRIHPIFGTRKLHTGIDISAGSGTPIVAGEAGKVLIAGGYGGYGNAVVIDHGGGLATLYAHQSTIAVSVGQTVGRGDTIGYVGCTGFCTGPHLHFETRENGVPVDPMKYLG